MGYLGLTPTTAQQNYLNIDDISGSFNGSTTSFALQVGSVAPTPFPVTNSCLISVGGVIQEPDDTGTSGFRISGGNIVFSSAPGTGEDFFGLILAGADYLNIGANFPDGTVGTPSITFDSDTNTGIYHPSADELSFVTGGSDRVRVDSNGRLGIGTSSPAASLNFGDAAANSGIQFGDGADFTIKRNTGDTTVDFNVGADLNHFQWKVGGINYMRLDSSGRLGIGTTSPQADLHIGSGTATGVEIDNTGTLQVIDRGNSRIEPLTVTAEYAAFSIARNSSTTLHDERARFTYNGLTFNGDTAAANALDDYEEGTWSPNDQSGTDIPNAIGLYTRIGRFVHCFVSFQGTSLNGLQEISNFPFAGQNTQYNGHVNLGYVMWAGGSTSAPFTPKTFYLYNNSQGGFSRGIFANRPGASEWVNTDYQAWTFSYPTSE